MSETVLKNAFSFKLIIYNQIQYQVTNDLIQNILRKNIYEQNVKMLKFRKIVFIF
jgi:hypothetical protein